MSPQSNPSERASSAEYLRESGLLLADISLLVDRLEANRAPKDAQEGFAFESFDVPFKLPEGIAKEIGPAHSAVVTYSRQPESSISVEIYGEAKAYYATRYEDTTSAPTDGILDITPVDSVSRALMSNDELRELTNNREHSSDFEKRITNIPGVSHKEFVELLMRLTYQDALPDELSDDEREKLAQTNLFDAEIFEQFVELSRVRTLSQTGTIDYDFLTSDQAHLSYFYEQGQPSSFDFVCIDDVMHLPIKFRGTIEKEIKIDFPVHAETQGIHKEIIDEVRSFPLSLREIKYLRSVIQDETETLPNLEELDETSINPDTIAADTDDIAAVEEEIQEHQKLADIEFEEDVYRLLHDDNTESED